MLAGLGLGPCDHYIGMKRIAFLALALLFPATAAFGQVVGGADAPVGKWDDTAAVYFGGNQGCTGVLIAPNVALTAGHCIGGISRIMVGSNDLNSGGELIDVIREVRHPSSNSTYDIGVLVLAEPAATTQPRTIARGCVAEQWLEDGAEVAIVGYGALNTNASGFTNILQEAFTTINDHDCEPASFGCQSAVSPGGELTAGGMGIDSCNGDSGGPLYLLTPRGAFLVGITSRAMFGGGGQPCGDGGIYVRPDAVIDWIEQTAGVTLPEPICNFAPEPSAPAIEVVAGESESTTVSANDQDGGDSHNFSVAAAPEFGTVEVDADGVATYTANGDYDGPDAFTIAVTDDGMPVETGEIVVAVTVLPSDDDCGCRSSGGGSGWLIGLAVLGLVISSSRRRRRGAASRS